ncbi:GL14249 [Drosophila persimilis]|uniref:GL14249 n=1 Tax=Drosophila persimilis TaxID=7234 RepID=B4GTM0_DROPE|nr:GL14249 [Drosophila persimilis]
MEEEQEELQVQLLLPAKIAITDMPDLPDEYDYYSQDALARDVGVVGGLSPSSPSLSPSPSPSLSPAPQPAAKRSKRLKANSMQSCRAQMEMKPP